jgi:hypothetical protein
VRDQRVADGLPALLDTAARLDADRCELSGSAGSAPRLSAPAPNEFRYAKVWIESARKSPVGAGEVESGLRDIKKSRRPKATAFVPCGRRPRSVAGVDFRFSTARRQAGDLVDVGAIDADVLQLTIRIARELVQDIPVTTTLFQESRDERELHIGSPSYFCPAIPRERRNDGLGFPGVPSP